MDGNYINAFLLTLFAGLATGIGGLVIMFVRKFSPKVLSAALGFSAGVMILISFTELFTEAQDSFSLLYGEKPGFLYTLLSFFGGMGIIALIDRLVPSYENPHEVNDMTVEVHDKAIGALPHKREGKTDGEKKLLRIGLLSSVVIAVHNFPEGLATFVSAMESNSMGISIAFAIALHNIPEGMAIGVVYAGYLDQGTHMTAAAALALSIGIAIQNFPEGAIISMPLKSDGTGRGRAFGYGMLSGIVEPVGAMLAILGAGFVVPVLPYCLSFAAGAMLYVVVEELIPEMSQGPHSNVGTISFAIGFAIMMMLDVALG